MLPVTSAARRIDSSMLTPVATMVASVRSDRARQALRYIGPITGTRRRRRSQKIFPSGRLSST